MHSLLLCLHDARQTLHPAQFWHRWVFRSAHPVNFHMAQSWLSVHTGNNVVKFCCLNLLQWQPTCSVGCRNWVQWLAWPLAGVLFQVRPVKHACCTAQLSCKKTGPPIWVHMVWVAVHLPICIIPVWGARELCLLSWWGAVSNNPGAVCHNTVYCSTHTQLQYMCSTAPGDVCIAVRCRYTCTTATQVQYCRADGTINETLNYPFLCFCQTHRAEQPPLGWAWHLQLREARKPVRWLWEVVNEVKWMSRTGSDWVRHVWGSAVERLNAIESAPRPQGSFADPRDIFVIVLCVNQALGMVSSEECLGCSVCHKQRFRLSLTALPSWGLSWLQRTLTLRWLQVSKPKLQSCPTKVQCQEDRGAPSKMAFSSQLTQAGELQLDVQTPTALKDRTFNRSYSRLPKLHSWWSTRLTGSLVTQHVSSIPFLHCSSAQKSSSQDKPSIMNCSYCCSQLVDDWSSCWGSVVHWQSRTHGAVWLIQNLTSSTIVAVTGPSQISNAGFSYSQSQLLSQPSQLRPVKVLWAFWLCCMLLVLVGQHFQRWVTTLTFLKNTKKQHQSVQAPFVREQLKVQTPLRVTGVRCCKNLSLSHCQHWLGTVQPAVITWECTICTLGL